MTKLSGTSGQLFAGLAESLVRGVSRSVKGSATTGAKTPDDSSFHDLLHTVSNMAKRALDDQNGDTTAKTAAPVLPRIAQLTGRDTPKDETAHERSGESKSSRKQDRIDKSAKAEVPNRSNVPTIMGQELAAAPAVTMQTAQPSSDKKETSARDERPAATKREVQSTTSTAKADVAPSATMPSTAAHSASDASGPRPQPAMAAQASAAGQAMPQESDVQPKGLPMPGFEAVAANVEHAAKSAGRDALPETTKVTVVQQETHLPPVAQFGATQQVANAVVSELKSSPAPAASASPGIMGAQSNSPDQPLRILTVNLEPPDLGNVTMRLRLVGNEVSVQLAAERKDTSTMLDQQRDQIRDLMQSAGYVADVAPVQHGSLDGFQSGSGQPQPQLSGQQQQSSQSQGAFGGAGTSSGQSDGGARQARQERQLNQEARHDQDVAPHTRRGPVYL
ncbi:flagellar hook-length control protein FliK [Bradyrhizobium guangdongense]|uniref:Flagellar hook-length control protein FliK n=1 Tax=Bradyrhizobium guangdongense TaxID=1325090 RepID=A0A410V281_9BRAD|nr:flagellar hook-length control protein FliK [Bradyrhizobium guangdongense]QAU37794.1 flagellar hook-length control protein FliK [Bradyrhizobium guangdongense]QOZ58852.1 flagellar hook-length control protein FliK [Bradyrhizobium guangdongense]GGI19535.1 flagellar hook-length control protein FliK [Bradyrhizobium guangdongense]